MRKKSRPRKVLSFLLCTALIFCVLAACAACGHGDTGGTNDGSAPSSEGAPESGQGVTQLGTGGVGFKFTVTDKDGGRTVFDVKTDEKTVGAALLGVGLIEGEDGQYGLYVKKVNGILADYDKNGTYWAFYVNGEYAVKGVDQTEIDPGAEYEFRAEK